MKRGECASTQLRPDTLPAGEPWWWRCPYCQADTQGGREGLEAHVTTVHPGKTLVFP